MFYLILVLILATVIIAILSAVRPGPAILWIAVILLAIIDALHYLPAVGAGGVH